MIYKKICMLYRPTNSKFRFFQASVWIFERGTGVVTFAGLKVSVVMCSHNYVSATQGSRHW
jgi:hypothetical protein